MPAEDQTSISHPQPGSPSRHPDMVETVNASTDSDVISEIFPRNTASVDCALKVSNCTAELALDSRLEEVEETLELVQEWEPEKEQEKEHGHGEDGQGAYCAQSHSAHDIVLDTQTPHDTDTDTAVFADELELAAWTELPPSPILKKRTPKRARTSTSPPPTVMPPTHPIPLLICSIGNPGAQYANTLHSAGHTLLASLMTLIHASPLTKDRAWGNGLVSCPSYASSQPQWTLFQSGSYMNESGKPVAKAYTQWARTLDRDVAAHAKVVVLHDELERPLGNVIVREGQGLSARGHNGIKSLLQTMGKTGFVRVGVGIGRPVQRDSRDVAEYVLRKMTPVERERVQGAAGEVLERLKVLSGS